VNTIAARARRAPRGTGAAASREDALRTSFSVYRALASAPDRPAQMPQLTSEPWQRLLAEAPRPRRPLPSGAWRGRLDALALRTRLSNARIFAALAPERPAARLLYSLLEQARVETLGSRGFPGIRENLAALALERWHRARPQSVLRTGDAWVETFGLLARAPLGAPLPALAQHALLPGWRQWMSATEAASLERLAGLLDDQLAFARQSREVIGAVLGREALEPPAAPAPAPAQHEESEEPGVQPRVKSEASAEQATESAVSGDPMAWQELAHTTRPEPLASAAPARPFVYRIFTTAFDEIVEPEALCNPAELATRRRELDELAAPHLRSLARWAHRLQRRLMTLQMRSWQFDLEEGLLDASRLSRVVTQPLEPLAYKQENEARFPDTVVTLLIDASGSMRGRPIATAAVCAELLGRVLEQCGVRSEMLGFTTRAWRGGAARLQWVSSGSPAHPGRISELRHILFKRADQPWRRARAGLGALLEPSLLKENIDGEALLWAQGRLMRRPEPRRILLVISDGAPMDEATLEANGADYLERHLREVIRRIEHESAIELAAIGIGHAVDRYYRRAVTVRGPEELGEAVVHQLFDLLEAA
jgi:cobaltochelatase CobT